MTPAKKHHAVTGKIHSLENQASFNSKLIKKSINPHWIAFFNVSSNYFYDASQELCGYMGILYLRPHGMYLKNGYILSIMGWKHLVSDLYPPDMELGMFFL